ncbi:hypothetical protein LJ737_08975 [Hymenobacter sp. 15J16-1T3B]|uniref:hypothetical protein n=1 Tax=Hymenobacter sp. 15J16-1T3B TaxID=2886941 RepID=UPI001D1228A3|nr:hypothetical protein [Hymenobacter sp. 15J16-1T3B]MCC3157371.1 hypothetical protein [Hymenobacter sp. 15J16-1T3B]
MRYFPLIAAVAGLAACQTGQPDAERNPTLEAVGDSAASATEASSPPAETAAAIRRVVPQLRGVWVQSAYLDAVARTRSPYQGWKSLAEVTEMHLAPPARSADSLLVGASLGNHEGGQFAVYLRPGRHPQTLPTSFPDYQQPGNYYELRYQPAGADTTLHLDKYDRRHRRLSSVSYRRVQLPARLLAEDDLGLGLQYAVNALLLTGRFAGQDSAGRAVSLRFQPEGTVTGFPAAKRYFVATDFGSGPENNLDVLTLEGPSARQNFAYRFGHDTLRLYALRPDADHIDLRPARLHYTLIRR